MRHRVAVDVGGTFIDFVLLDETTGTVTIEKQPSTPDRLVDELLAGLARLEVPVADVHQLFHGTTVAINAVLQERGARVGLLTTAGFRDVLAIGRGNRPEIYNFLYRGPQPLVPRHLRREVPERLAADGSILTRLDLDAVDRESDVLVSQGVEAIAICFLHAYANPTHEAAAAERIRERHPAVTVTASHEIATEWREYERTSTTVLNAFVQPLFAGYVGRLEAGLAGVGYTRPLALMQSNGGVIGADRAVRLPIRTLESGPAGGVIGSQALARELDLRNVICADVGGTSYDVALIEDGQILERTETKIARRPIVGPTIDIVSIGAGGGSIAWIDHRGALQVGPRSAGASPGPACFGLGGTEPTVTDCHLLLGRLDPANFLGARMLLDPAAAERAVETIAGPLGLDIEQAALGTLAIAETNMTYAIRGITVERGLDPREFAMLSYGGGGGLFAAAVADELEIPTVVVPRAPANFSAWGILTSDYREDAALTRVLALDRRNGGGARRVAAGAGGPNGRPARFLRIRAQVRPSWSRVPICASPARSTRSPCRSRPPGSTTPARCSRGIRERFVAAHRQLYGHGDADAPLEVVAARVRAVGLVATPRWPEWTVTEPGAPRTERAVCFRTHGTVATPVFDREALARDQRIEGPVDRRGVDGHDRRAAGLDGSRRPARQPRAREGRHDAWTS